jgi:hypothetical protein
VRSSSREERPARTAARAVARQWLDWAPPQVITVSAPWASASASRNSSFLTLLPDNSLPVKSSRLKKISTPACRLSRSIFCKGVGVLAS